MAKFYDTLDSRELERVENILSFAGIGYTVQAARTGAPVKEILVAEEDLVFADMLLTSQSSMH
jgi:hypothetical protein